MDVASASTSSRADALSSKLLSLGAIPLEAWADLYYNPPPANKNYVRGRHAVKHDASAPVASGSGSAPAPSARMQVELEDGEIDERPDYAAYPAHTLQWLHSTTQKLFGNASVFKFHINSDNGICGFSLRQTAFYDLTQTQ